MEKEHLPFLMVENMLVDSRMINMMDKELTRFSMVQDM